MDGRLILSEWFLATYKITEDDHHNDEDDGGHPGSDGDVMPVFDIKEIIPIVDTILREDDKVVGKSWPWLIFICCRTKMDTLAGQSLYPSRIRLVTDHSNHVIKMKHSSTCLRKVIFISLLLWPK